MRNYQRVLQKVRIFEQVNKISDKENTEGSAIGSHYLVISPGKPGGSQGKKRS